MRTLKSLEGLIPLTIDMQKSILGGKHGADDTHKEVELLKKDDKTRNRGKVKTNDDASRGKVEKIG